MGRGGILYAGGDPFVNLDLLVGPMAGQPDGASDVAAELYAGPGYLRFDPGILRGGDAKGRSTATVAVSATAGVTTFAITATTPDMDDGEMGPVDVDTDGHLPELTRPTDPNHPRRNTMPRFSAPIIDPRRPR